MTPLRRKTDRPAPWQVVAAGVAVEHASLLSALVSHPHPLAALAEVVREWVGRKR